MFGCRRSTDSEESIGELRFGELRSHSATEGPSQNEMDVEARSPKGGEQSKKVDHLESSKTGSASSYKTVDKLGEDYAPTCLGICHDRIC